MGVFGAFLFYRSDMVVLSDVLRHGVDQLGSAVDGLPDREFVEKSDAEIASQIALDRAIAPLVVDFDGATAAVVETEVEVQDHFSYRGGGSISVPGLVATKSIPFTGEPDLWQLHAGPGVRTRRAPRSEATPSSSV